MRCPVIVTKILRHACQVIIVLICFLPLVLWPFLEAIVVESWWLCAPARRNPNRAHSCGLLFALRSAKRRRLSILEDAVDDHTTSETAAATARRKARGFFDMPYELREQIWLDVLCPVGVVQVSNHPRGRKVTWTMRDLEEGQQPSQYGLTKMLKLNRRFYREGIELLYAHNSFAFSSANVLTSFTRSVLPQRLALIKHLTLTVHSRTLEYNIGRYNKSFMDSDWQVACVSMRRFTGLKTLRINLRIESYFSSMANRPRWDGFAGSRWPKKLLAPLEPLSASDEFIVRYTWPERDCSQWPKGNFKMEHDSGRF